MYLLLMTLFLGARFFDEYPKTIIKQGSSIGAGAIILPGITVGENAMIGAGSVVTKNVGNGLIVVGNPARKVGTTDDY